MSVPTQPIATILGIVKVAADAALTATEVAVPPLTEELITTFNAVVVPKLDIPAFLIPFITGEEPKLKTPLDTFAKAELELLRLRVDALL